MLKSKVDHSMSADAVSVIVGTGDTAVEFDFERTKKKDTVDSGNSISIALDTGDIDDDRVVDIDDGVNDDEEVAPAARLDPAMVAAAATSPEAARVINARVLPEFDSKRTLVHLDQRENDPTSLLMHFSALTEEELVPASDRLMQRERIWLDEHPQNDGWRGIQERIADVKQRSNELEEMERNAHLFLKTQKDRDEMRRHQPDLRAYASGRLQDRDHADWERCIVTLARQLLDSVVEANIASVCQEVGAMALRAWDLINTPVVRSLANLSEGNKRFWKMSGREYVLRGALVDVENSISRIQQVPSVLVHQPGMQVTTKGKVAVLKPSEPQMDQHANGQGIEESDRLDRINPASHSAVHGGSRPAVEAPSTGLSSSSNSTATSVARLPRPWIAGGGCDGCDGEDFLPAYIRSPLLDRHNRVVLSQPKLTVGGLRSLGLRESALTLQRTQGQGHSVGGQTRRPTAVGQIIRLDADAHRNHYSSTSNASNATHNALPGHSAARFHQQQQQPPSLAANLGSCSVTVAADDPLVAAAHIESTYWKGVSGLLAENAPVQLPSSGGKAVGTSSVVRLLTQTAQRNSTLVCGTTAGRVAVWMAPWTGGEVRFVGISSKTDNKERSPVVEIKPASIATNTFISMTKAGFVNVWHLNSALSSETNNALVNKRRRGGGWFGGGGGVGSKGSEHLISSIFQINFNDMIFSFPANADAESAHGRFFNFSSLFGGSIPISDTFPAQVCFHPSLTVVGRNTSFLVGSVGGEIIKYNMDYLAPLTNMGCAVVFPKHAPFVTREYIHPHNAPAGFVLTAGVLEKKGNKVFREILHHHRSKIILLDVMHKVSDTVISLDDTGVLCGWQYHPQFLQGKCWFRPSFSAQFSLDVKKEFLPTDLFHRELPDEAVRSAMVCVGVSADGEGRLVRRYAPIWHPQLHVFLEYQSVEIPRTPHGQREEGDGDGADEESEASEKVVPETPLFSTSVTVNPMARASNSTSVEPHSSAEKDSAGKSGSMAMPDSSSHTVGAAADIDVAGAAAGDYKDSVGALLKDMVSRVESTAESERTPSEAVAAAPSAQQGVQDVGQGEAIQQQGEVTKMPTVHREKVDSEDGQMTAVPRGGSPAEATAVPRGGSPAEATAVPRGGSPAEATDDRIIEAAVLSLVRAVEAAAGADGEGVRSVQVAAVVLALVDSVATAAGEAQDSSRDPITSLAGSGHNRRSLDVTVHTMTPVDLKGVKRKGKGKEKKDKSTTKKGKKKKDKKTKKEKKLEKSGRESGPEVENIEGSVSDGEKDQEEEQQHSEAFVRRERSDSGASSSFTEAASAPGPPASLAAGDGRAEPAPQLRWSEGELVIPRALKFAIESVKTSFDGTELVLLLSAPVAPVHAADRRHSNRGRGVASADSGGAAAAAEVAAEVGGATVGCVYYLVPFLLDERRFHHPFPKLFLSPSDAVLDFCIGPLILETLSRTVFVLTKRRVRAFSLLTGQEVQNALFPFRPTLKAFSPTQLSVCPSQRVLTLAAADDARIAVYVLQHSEDGNTFEHPTDPAAAPAPRHAGGSHMSGLSRIPEYERYHSEHTKAFLWKHPHSHRLDALRRIAIKTVLAFVVRAARPQQHAQATQEVGDVVEALLDDVHAHAERRRLHRLRGERIAHLYGGSDSPHLGSVQPTAWPPPDEAEAEWERQVEQRRRDWQAEVESKRGDAAATDTDTDAAGTVDEEVRNTVRKVLHAMVGCLEMVVEDQEDLEEGGVEQRDQDQPSGPNGLSPANIQSSASKADVSEQEQSALGSGSPPCTPAPEGSGKAKELLSAMAIYESTKAASATAAGETGSAGSASGGAQAAVEAVRIITESIVSAVSISAAMEILHNSSSDSGVGSGGVGGSGVSGSGVGGSGDGSGVGGSGAGGSDVGGSGVGMSKIQQTGCKAQPTSSAGGEASTTESAPREETDS